MIINAFDIVVNSIKVAEAQSRKSTTLRIDYLDIIKSYCEGVDSILRFANGTGFKAESDPGSGTIKMMISCQCPQFDYSEKNPGAYYFTELVLRAIRTEFRTDTNGDVVVITFVFPGVWEVA